jgi:hypothetical protein
MSRVLMLALALSVVAASTASTQSAPPHPEEAAILAIVDRFMLAIADKDPAALNALRLEGGFYIVERPSPTGGTLVARRVFTPPSGNRTVEYRERYWDPIVHVRGSIAVVWTPYEFWTDGKTSHCGIDVFEMMKDQGTWKIANMMWTVEPDACAALRPADPARIRPAG